MSLDVANHRLPRDAEQTGMEESREPTIVIDVPFGNYVVRVRLTARNEFAGIQEVRSNVNFLDADQLRSLPSIDVDAYYKEDNDK